MTLKDDVELIRKALKPEWDALHVSLDRIEAALPIPDPTLWEQFESIPIGKSFWIERDGYYTFLKVADNTAVRADRTGGLTFYSDMRQKFKHWEHSTTKFKVKE